MSGKPQAIGPELFAEMFAHARESFPAECCGWLEGEGDGVDAVRRCHNAQADGQHPTTAARGEETAYVIAGADLLALNKGLDSPRPPKVIYHSHPNGRAYFSATDREVATSPWGGGPTYPVQQLVVGLTESEIVEAALFDWDDQTNDFVEIARWTADQAAADGSALSGTP